MSLRILMPESTKSKRQAVTNGVSSANGSSHSMSMTGYTNASGAATQLHYGQSQQSFGDCNMQLTAIERQERPRREAVEADARAQNQSDRNAVTNNSSSTKEPSADAVQQYYRMLREEQERRIQELRTPQ